MSQDVDEATYQESIDRKALPRLGSSVGTGDMIRFNSE